MSENTKSNRRNPKLATLGVDDTLGAGDSSLVLDVLPQDLADLAFANMRKEVKWNTMFHRGGEVPRLVAVEGDVDTDGRYFSTSYSSFPMQSEVVSAVSRYTDILPILPLLCSHSHPP